jgi:DNA-binding transcriptional ArsR family regulator
MRTSLLNEHTAARVAELFRSFSDPSRVRIIYAILEEEEVNTSRLAELLALTSSAVSHHLRGLRQKQIVEARREGKEVYYSVIDPHIVALFQQGVDHVRENQS